MLNKKNITRNFIIILPLLIILAGCPKNNQEAKEQPAAVNTENTENIEAYESDDEEYDSSNVYSQDSDP